MHKRNTEEAFLWIVNILKNHKIPFQITGGLAAKVYGSKRKLADIDIDSSKKYFKILMPEIKNYIKAGPNRYRDKNWDLYSITLKYKGQVIDLCGIENTKIFDCNTRKWVKLRSDISKAVKRKIYGVNVLIQSKDELVAYKKKLGRKVDRTDVRQIEN